MASRRLRAKVSGASEQYALVGAATRAVSYTHLNVTLGESNASFVEVVAGLTAGESVAVNDMKDFESYKSLTIKH